MSRDSDIETSLSYRDGTIAVMRENVLLRQEVDDLKEKLTATSTATPGDVIKAQVLLHTTGTAVAYPVLAAIASSVCAPDAPPQGLFDHPYLMAFMIALNLLIISITWTARKFGS